MRKNRKISTRVGCCCACQQSLQFPGNEDASEKLIQFVLELFFRKQKIGGRRNNAQTLKQNSFLNVIQNRFFSKLSIRKMYNPTANLSFKGSLYIRWLGHFIYLFVSKFARQQTSFTFLLVFKYVNCTCINWNKVRIQTPSGII